MITVGSLFAGIGGFDLGFERCGMQCKWQVEIDDYATRILERHWPDVHRQRDIKQCGRNNLERVDVIIGGFPCQDISYAGKGAGLDGERSGLFFEAIRLVRELRPRAVVLENVAGLLTRGLDRVLGTLAEIGFDAEWHCIPAAAVGAPHIRDRVFILAYSNCKPTGTVNAKVAELPGGVADAEVVGLERQRSTEQQVCFARPFKKEFEGFCGSGAAEHWAVEPDVGGIIDGFSKWLDGNNQLIVESHDRIMAYVIQQTGDFNANATKKRTSEVLQYMRDCFNQENFQWTPGRFVSISSQEVLFAYLCKHTEQTADKAWLQLQGKETFKASLRSVWPRKKSSSPSRRPKSSKQQSGKHSNALQALPRFLAQDARAAWMGYCGKNASPVLSEWGPGWEAGTLRVAHGVSNRVDRLKCLGNAIVPQVAEVVGRILLERIGGEE